jgi:hypothetical protein
MLNRLNKSTPRVCMSFQPEGKPCSDRGRVSVLIDPPARFNPDLVSDSSLYPNEVASDFSFIPFGAGARKCIGDQFAMLEAGAIENKHPNPCLLIHAEASLSRSL